MLNLERLGLLTEFRTTADALAGISASGRETFLPSALIPLMPAGAGLLDQGFDATHVRCAVRQQALQLCRRRAAGAAEPAELGGHAPCACLGSAPAAGPVVMSYDGKVSPMDAFGL